MPTVTADCVVQPGTPVQDKYPPQRFASAITFDPHCPPGDADCAAWRQFRNDHPYPVQSFAGKRVGDGRAILVLSEPPPDLSHDEAKAIVTGAFQDLKPRVETRSWQIGPDGYVEDVLVSFDAADLSSDDLLSSPDLRDRIAALNVAWFGTACGGDVETIGDGNARVPGAAPNLEVSAKDIGEWMSDPAQRWIRIEEATESEQSWNDIVSAKAGGAYLSHDGQLVLFTFARSVLDDPEQLKALRPAFRRFATSTDGVIGAFWGKDGGSQVALIGRRRTHPQSQIAPLRFETFEMLVGQGQDHLAQSYERTSAVAGRIRSESRDWAPIYLSNALRDTEFGTLLNVTDQMLKGWSEHGEVSYLTFAYPRTPEAFPFEGKPLSDIVKERTQSDTTLFNWNTRGAAVAVDRGDLTVFVARKTGALPIDYGADLPGRAGDPKTGGLRDLEDKAYAYFSGLGDPNLARVVQYTLIYQAVRNLREDSGSSAVEPDITELKPESRKLADATLELWPTMIAKNGEFAERLAWFKSQHPDIPDDAIAVLMVDRNEGTDVVQRQGVRLTDEAMSDLAVLANAFGADLWDNRVDLAPIRDSFNMAAKHAVPGWVRTQSHIISWSKDKEVVVDGRKVIMFGVGGHNLDAAADHFVSGGISDISATAGGKISVAVEDADKFAAHAAEYSRALRHGKASEAELRAILDRPIPQRPRWEALGYRAEKMEPSVARLGGRVFDSQSPFVAALRRIKERVECCRVMARDAEGNAFIAEANPVPPPAFRVTGFGDTASLGGYMRRFEGKPDDIIVLDQSQASVEAMLGGFGTNARGFRPLDYMRERYRNFVQRLSGRNDHLILDDVDGQPGSLTIRKSAASDAERVAEIGLLKSQKVRVATIEDVPATEAEQLAAASGWNLSREAAPVAVRVRFQPEKSGGFQTLDIFARFSRPKEQQIVRQAVGKVLNSGGDREIAAAVISVRRELQRSGDLSQILFVLKRGTVAMQLAAARSRRVAV